MTAAYAKTPMMAILFFVGPQIGATGYYYQYVFYLPYLHLEIVNCPTSSNSIMPVIVDFTATIPTMAAAGFPVAAADRELLIQWKSDVSSNLILLN